MCARGIWHFSFFFFFLKEEVDFGTLAKVLDSTAAECHLRASGLSGCTRLVIVSALKDPLVVNYPYLDRACFESLFAQRQIRCSVPQNSSR